MTTTLRTLIVGGDPESTGLLKSLLEAPAAVQVVGEFARLSPALHEGPARRPDLVIVELSASETAEGPPAQVVGALTRAFPEAAVFATGADVSADFVIEAIRAGVRDDPRAHLRHAAEPEKPSQSRRRAFGEAWAALSVGLLIVLLVVVIWLRILPPIVALPVVLGGYLAIEAFFDRSIGTLLLRIAMFLAIISAIILAVTFIRELVLLVLLGLGLLLIIDNFGELRRRSD